MVSWLDVARVLAKESAYRSARRRESIRSWSLWRGSRSVIKANLIPAILYTIISSIIGLGIVIASSDPSGSFPLLFGAMGAMELVLSLFAVATSTSIMTSQGLLEPLSYRPVEESTLHEAVMAASLIYWGVGTSVLLVIPASIILSVKLMTPYPVAAGTVMALTLLLLAYGAGVFVASLAPSVRTDPRLRFLATLAWIFLLLVGYLPSLLNTILGGTSQVTFPDLGLLAELIPPFNFGTLATGNLSPLALTSCVITLAVSLIILRFSSNRLWVSLIQGPPTSPSAARLSTGTRPGWTVRGHQAVLGLSIKDLKLLVRSPQRLATFIVYPVIFILPILISFLQLQGKPPPPLGALSLTLRTLVTAIIPSMGALLGVLSEQFYYIEGEGARDLYRLPLTKRELALSKALSSFLTLLPAGLILFAMVSYFWGIPQGLMVLVLLETNVAASLIISSSSTVSSLPREPSAWSERSIGAKRMAIRLGLVIGSIALAGFFALIAITTPIGESAMAGLSVVLTIIAVMMYRRVRDMPLTS
jgi:hypothetical protein